MSQICRDCAAPFPYDEDADRCPACVAEHTDDDDPYFQRMDETGTDCAERLASLDAADDHSASRSVDVLQRDAPHLLAQPDEPRPSLLRIVVTRETDNGEPELLGTYTRSEGDAVFYMRPGGRENYAPADCCEIVKVAL